MGTDKDKMVGTFFGFDLMSQQQLEAAYRGDWIARKIVDIPAYDATREWRNWQAESGDITMIEELEKDFGLQRKLALAMQRGRLYGGGALIMGVDQGNPDEPLELEALGKDCLKFVHVVSRYELSAGEMNYDVLDPFYGEPKYYTRSNNAGVSVKLHPSRVIRFVGAEIPDLAQSQGWGDPILQIVADAVKGAGTVTNGTAQLVNEAKIDIIKIPESKRTSLVCLRS
jgi:phage-related protein (TIGR01555 family)